MSTIDLIQHYYGLFAQTTPTAAYLDGVVAPEWTNGSSDGEEASIDQFVGNVAGLRAAVPDLAWTVREIIDGGDTVTVIAEGSGTPAETLFGSPVNGGSFRILSIDVHRVADGQIARTQHVEDWATALRQVGK